MRNKQTHFEQVPIEVVEAVLQQAAALARMQEKLLSAVPGLERPAVAGPLKREGSSTSEGRPWGKWFGSDPCTARVGCALNAHGHSTLRGRRVVPLWTRWRRTSNASAPRSLRLTFAPSTQEPRARTQESLKINADFPANLLMIEHKA